MDNDQSDVKYSALKERSVGNISTYVSDESRSATSSFNNNRGGAGTGTGGGANDAKFLTPSDSSNQRNKVQTTSLKSQDDFQLAFSPSTIKFNKSSDPIIDKTDELVVTFRDDKSSQLSNVCLATSPTTTLGDTEMELVDDQPMSRNNGNYSILANQNRESMFMGPGRGKQQRSSLERTLLYIVALLLVLFAVVSAYAYFLNHKFNSLPNSLSDKNNKYCLTDKCILVTGAIYKQLNQKVDPCDDFYEYACGGWIKKNLIPTGFPKWGTLSSITYGNQLLIREQLESNLTVPDITEAEMKAKLFYQSCIDKNEIIEKLGSTPLTNILNKFMSVSKNSTLVVNETFENLFTYVQVQLGLNALFEINVNDDDKNSSYSDIQVLQGSLGLDRSFFINNSSEKNQKAVDIYRKTIISILKLLYEKVNNVEEEADNLLTLEYRLANVMISTENLSNIESMYSRVKLADLTRDYAPFINWSQLINKFFIQYGAPSRVTDDDTIIILGLDYFKNLKSLIDEYKRDPQKEKTLKFFVIFHLIRFSLPLLSKEYRNQFIALGEVITGTNSVERWQTCIEHTDNVYTLGYAIARMFIRKAPNNAKASAQKMIKSIKQSFIKNFPSTPWMDTETQVLAEEKVNHVDDLIGYPDFIEQDKDLNDRFKDLNISESDYFGNEIRLVQYALKLEILNYRTKVNRLDWDMSPSAVNAYYSPTRNLIVFPSGILQEPFFHPDNPMSLNYGSIGTIMGHELAHGFDDSGRDYDKNGIMHQWWNDKTIENFKKASECVVKQYSTYKIENEFLNGRMTLGENIADNGALKSAYHAYEQWIEENGEEKLLPLLNLTHRQLFFVSFAQTWCTKATADSIHFSLSVDQHSPPRYRVIGSISNSFEFSKAFSCPDNSKMNPADKCPIW